VSHRGSVSAPPGRQEEAFLDRLGAPLFLPEFPLPGGASRGSEAPQDDGDGVEVPGGETFPDELELGLGEGDAGVEDLVETPQIAAEAFGEAAKERVELLGNPEARLDGHGAGSSLRLAAGRPFPSLGGDGQERDSVGRREQPLGLPSIAM
jgi:hypothetical protein